MTMNEKTLAALHGSIAKWEAIVAGTGGDEGKDNCPLCEEFYDKSKCVGCPVAAKTGRSCCADTPYADFRNNRLRIVNRTWVPDSDEARAAAQAEVDFLKSLLPAENATS